MGSPNPSKNDSNSRSRNWKNATRLNCVLCGVLQNDWPDRKFYSFPKDSELSQKWAELSGKKWILASSPLQRHIRYRVCSIHFVDSDYITFKRGRLTSTAIPTLNESNSSYIKMESMKIKLYHKLQNNLVPKEESLEDKKSTSEKFGISVDESNSGEQCKNRWANIRDHFRRHMQKRKTKPGKAVYNGKKYKFEDQLQFLLIPSCQRDILPSVPRPQLEIQGAELSDKLPAEKLREAQTDTVQSTPPLGGHASRSRSPVKLSKKTTPTPPTSSVLMQCDPIQPTADPIDAFMAGIAATIKKLNPYHQHVAKGRIFDVVHELEAKELFNEYQSTSSSLHLSQHSQCDSGRIAATSNFRKRSDTNNPSSPNSDSHDPAADITPSDVLLLEYSC